MHSNALSVQDVTARELDVHGNTVPAFVNTALDRSAYHLMPLQHLEWE
jgi:hypothetical protein